MSVNSGRQELMPPQACRKRGVRAEMGNRASTLEDRNERAWRLIECEQRG